MPRDHSAPFRFKQFAVSHQASAMKVGTDGVTVGAWAPCAGRVLDVGCGCGLIGLMAAQRGAAEVTMIEIDPAAAAEAAANAAASPWADRLTVLCADFLSYAPSSPFDSIISNPPFFATGLTAPDPRRAAARHESALTPRAFMHRCASMLTPQGTLSLILPPDRLPDWTLAARLSGLAPTDLRALITRPDADPRRILALYSRANADLNPSAIPLLIGSQEYQRLTSPFYL